MRAIINYLFNKNYLPFDKRKKRVLFMSDKAKRKIYNSEKHQEFKDALLDDLCIEMAECIELQNMPLKGDLEMKGELNAIHRLYGRMIEIFAPEEELKKSEYLDPFKKIEEEAKKAMESRERS